ncbi:MAG: class I SAM-dependent methyltransferase [Tuberibacillus sp.]
MSDKKYLDFLAKFGISSAHPGGLPLTKAILERFPISKDEKVLDVGCGTGETSVYIAETFGAKVVAVDIHPMMMTHAKNRIIERGVDVELLQANAEKLPFQDHSFDKVIAESVTVFTKMEKSVSEYHRVLKPGGVLIDIEMTAERSLTKEETEEVVEVYEIEQVPTNIDWVDVYHQAGFTDITGYDGFELIKELSDLPNASAFDFTEAIDMDAFEAWLGHIQIMDKYRGLLNFRVFRAMA